jgi:hypothetical protein
MDPKKLLENVQWITKEGYFDPAKFPIDSVLKQAISGDDEEFRSGVSTLGLMNGHGRKEAGVFLLGLLVTCGDHWEKRIAIVEALRRSDTKGCADFLFGELKRVKSNNTTRRSLTTVIEVLASMPAKWVRDGFGSLAEDKSFSPKMRDKFNAVIEYRAWHDDDW